MKDSPPQTPKVLATIEDKHSFLFCIAVLFNHSWCLGAQVCWRMLLHVDQAMWIWQSKTKQNQ